MRESDEKPAEQPAGDEPFDPAAAVREAAGAAHPRCQVEYSRGQVSVLESYEEVAKAIADEIDRSVEEARPTMSSIELTIYDAHGHHSRISIAVGQVIALYEVTDERWAAIEKAREEQAKAMREAQARGGVAIVGGPPFREGPSS